MSAVLSLPAERRRAAVPVRVLAPWILAIAGCFFMAFGVGYAPERDGALPAATIVHAGVSQAGLSVLPGARAAAPGADTTAGERLTSTDSVPAGSPALKSLALLAFVAALAAAVLGSYRGHGLNGD